MFKLYRQLEPGEFIIAGGDCSQGGSDANCTQFFSKTKLDVPLVYHANGVAATQTADIYPALEKVADVTGVQVVVALERNNGGASEMERLKVLNKHNKYRCFLMPVIGNNAKPGESTDRLGVDTTSLSRPIIVGGLKEIVDVNGIRIYDQGTIDELSIFIENSHGKPEAAKGGHDDRVIALGVALYVSLFEHPVKIDGGTLEEARDAVRSVMQSIRNR